MLDRRRTLGLALACAALPSQVVADEDGNRRQSATVSFGTGLNNAQQGNVHNHHIVPDRIRIKAGGSVNFIVAGFHQIFVYEPGKTPQQVVIANPAALFINDTDRLYYQGLSPVAPPAPANTNPSNAINRVETVWFEKPGTYLVICNVRPHFIDGMIAWVVVSH